MNTDNYIIPRFLFERICALLRIEPFLYKNYERGAGWNTLIKKLSVYLENKNSSFYVPSDRTLKRWFCVDEEDTGITDAAFKQFSLAVFDKPDWRQLLPMGVSPDDLRVGNRFWKEIHPEHFLKDRYYFQNLEEAINTYNKQHRHTGITSSHFYHNNLFQDKALFFVLQKEVQNKKPVALMGRWGVGKTIQTLLFCLHLERELNWTTFYFDFHMFKFGSNYDNILAEALLLTKQSQCLFVLDNTHIIPELANKFLRWSKTSNQPIVFTTRPIDKNNTTHKDYFLYSFNDIDGESDYYIHRNNYLLFEIKANPEIGEYLIRQKLVELGFTENLDFERIAALLRSFGFNLSLLQRHLANIHAVEDTERIFQVDEKSIYQEVLQEYQLIKYPFLYVAAALNFFDLPAKPEVIAKFKYSEIQSIFNNPVEGNDFSDFLQGRFYYSPDSIWGIPAGEALLIINAGNSIKSEFLLNNGLYSDNELETIEKIIHQYCSQLPFDILNILYGVVKLEKELTDSYLAPKSIATGIVNLVFEDDKIRPYLRTHLKKRTNRSLYQLGVFLQIISATNVPYYHYNKVLSSDWIQTLIIEVRQNNPKFKFTDTCFDIWLSLIKLNQKNWAQAFLEEFSKKKTKEIISFLESSLYSFYLGLRIVAVDENFNFIISNKYAHILNHLRNKSEDKMKGHYWFHTLRFVAKINDQELDIATLNALDPSFIREIISSAPSVGANLVRVVHKINNRYEGTLLNQIDDNFLYESCYKNTPITALSSSLRPHLIRKYFKEEGLQRLLSSDLKEIQLFIRNLRLHEFSNKEVDIINEYLDSSEVYERIKELILNEKENFKNITYLFRHLFLVNPDLADELINDIDFNIALKPFVGNPNKANPVSLSLYVWLLSKENSTIFNEEILFKHVESSGKILSARDYVQYIQWCLINNRDDWKKIRPPRHIEFSIRKNINSVLEKITNRYSRIFNEIRHFEIAVLLGGFYELYPSKNPFPNRKEETIDYLRKYAENIEEDKTEVCIHNYKPVVKMLLGIIEKSN